MSARRADVPSLAAVLGAIALARHMLPGPDESPANGTVAAPARPDPWAHRRAEPRPLAAAWTLFLLGVGLVTIGPMGLAGLSSWDAYRPAARTMVVLMVVGIVVLWPMLRLCQEAPARPGRACLADALVILIPAQIVLWPQCWPWMADWPVRVVATVAAGVTAWTLITGALLAVALDRGARAPDAAWRTLWMLAFLVLAFAGLLIDVAAGSPADASLDVPGSPWKLASPIGLVHDCLAGRPWSGRPATIWPSHVAAAGWSLGSGLTLWGFYGLLMAGRPGRA